MTFIFQTDGKTIASVGIATILAQSVYVAATVTVLHTYILPYRAKNIFTPIKPTPTVPDYMAAISATVAVVVVRVCGGGGGGGIIGGIIGGSQHSRSIRTVGIILPSFGSFRFQMAPRHVRHVTLSDR